ncbi:hypothetical protein BJP36_19275 [Moorena producens JHB]|uniref:Uncharacterized protein n=1 Tax=Moorena producens (strain JHB) TaxID=1454205 RepID=A0A1D9G2H9_MOOP1|nr:hypothetical protein [Moorena producens]AOY81734.1 hypothetical protein BJP36_19275 [Moorena producens JHB]
MVPSTNEIILSQTNTAECIKKPNRSIIEFSKGKSLEAIAFKRFRLSKKQKVEGSNKPIDVILPQQSFLYWNYWNRRGLEDAIKIVIACGIDSIVSRSYQAFGLNLTLEERDALIRENAELLYQAQRLKKDHYLAKEALAEPDILDDENWRLRQQIREMGGVPYDEQIGYTSNNPNEPF